VLYASSSSDKITIFMFLCIHSERHALRKKPPLILTGDRLVGREAERQRGRERERAREGAEH